MYFKALVKDREESAKMLEKPSMRGIKNSVVEKYSDQAHFIYELLQNADDAKATYAHFKLYQDKLVFSHNGSRRFTVSNPDTEEVDKKEEKMGDINAITSIANSSKTDASIGKFGVGFKAVFQYTSNPKIYDPNIFFRIERFIVPRRIEEDFLGRSQDETLFVFPFDHSERNSEESYEDIAHKLCSLTYPILFLENLKEVSFEIGTTYGKYSKQVEKYSVSDDATVERVYLTKVDGSKEEKDELWLFSRKDTEGDKGGGTYSVGFFLDKEGKLQPRKYAAFCFFPTKEITDLNFIVHAPFQLTDSREGIKAADPHNKRMINLLAELAADSLSYLKYIGENEGVKLIDDTLLGIIPYDVRLFNPIDDRSKISFKPFFDEIKQKLSIEELLPSSEGYVKKENAYWAFTPEIPKIFDNQQLAMILGNEEAKWVFTSLGRQETARAKDKRSEYIDQITYDWLEDKDIIAKITDEFIQSQSVEWLYRFYKYVKSAEGRIKLIKTKPIFINHNNETTAAFDANGQAILFLPIEGGIDYNTINERLLDDEDTEELIKMIGIKQPSLRSEIYTMIMPQYQEGKAIDTTPHFLKFFRYYKQCPQAEVEEYIDLIKDCAFIKYRSKEDVKLYRGKGSSLYLPTENLVEYFQIKPDIRFVELDYYRGIIDDDDEKYLLSFLKELGVSDTPKVIIEELTRDEAYQIRKSWPRSTGYTIWKEISIEGCKELIDFVISTSDTNLSQVLWAVLCEIISVQCTKWKDFKKVLSGTYKYFFRKELYEYFDSRVIGYLRTQPWLINIDNKFVSANNLTVQVLSELYDTKSEAAQELIRFLNIQDVIVEDDDDVLTEEQKRKIEIAEKIEAAGITLEELEGIIQQRKSRNKETGSSEGEQGGSDRKSRISRIAKEIMEGVNEEETAENEADDSDNRTNTSDRDEDDYTKVSVDYNKKIEEAKKKSEKELERIGRIQELYARADSSTKYTFGWFKALLKLEALNGGENSAQSKEVSISFAKVEREMGTSRTLVLRNPNRYIPQFMEDLADIPLVLTYGDQTKTLVIEVANVKSYTLRVKLKTTSEIEGIDFSLVTEARIEAKNPVFLLEELRKQFNQLPFNDSYNLQNNLCKNIEFVFGPPGTGKTTYLANKIIIPMMHQSQEVKVLVLTPTNKSADVLVNRIIDVMGADTSYPNWLVRFGATQDENIEQSGIYRDKSFDIQSLERNVTVTTIARLAYDYFIADRNKRIHLRELKWDYIIIDEASMIPLVTIMYPLYKKHPNKFIIAGDPFQIEPITSVSSWKNENIYTMVKLDSFTHPTTIPHPYKVELLTTQYRSIPAVGEVFSKLTYGGILKHNRSTESQRRLNIEEFIDTKPLNIIKFPISKYESIYRSKRLQGKSTYQLYSALFTFEFIRNLASKLETSNQGEKFSIGIIAPYRAQSDLIDKLIASADLPKSIDVQVGTIHGFQGDECDIIIVVFNPPPSISSSKEMFLNKQNIINVSISRARDYLFVIMPDDNTENVENLVLVKEVEMLFKQGGDYTELHTHELEELMFNNNHYLEENSFSTSHQQVNVYSEPERRYEVRSEDSAVDVQIHNV